MTEAPHMGALGVTIPDSSYVIDTFEDGKFLTFAREIRGGQMPTTIEILPEWIGINSFQAPTIAILERALDAPPQGSPG